MGRVVTLRQGCGLGRRERIRFVRVHGRRLGMDRRLLEMFSTNSSFLAHRTPSDGLTICPQNPDLKALGLLRFPLFITPPLDRVHRVIPQPRLHPNQTPREVDQIFQRPCHGAENARNALLPRHTRVHAHFRPTSRATSQRVYTGKMCRRSY